MSLSFIIKTANSKADEANPREVRARLNQHVLRLYVPVENVLALQIERCIDQLPQDDLTDKRREARDQRKMRRHAFIAVPLS